MVSFELMNTILTDKYDSAIKADSYGISNDFGVFLINYLKI
jgi:hypothetical protein